MAKFNLRSTHRAPSSGHHKAALRLETMESRLTPAAAGFHVAAYYPEWGIWDRDYDVEDVPADKLTHLIYAFANLTPGGQVVTFDNQAALNPTNETWLPAGGNFGQLNLLKQAHPHLKTMIGIGGWTLSENFSDAAATPSSRDTFSKSAVSFMKNNGFDGIAIDWEYPLDGGEADTKHRPEDKHNFTLMLQDLRVKLDNQETLDGKQYELTAALGAGSTTVDNYELALASQYVDWFDLMSYDYHGGWEQTTNHQAATKSPSTDPNHPEFKNNVEWSVNYYLNAGLAPDKLSMGLPLYGKAWQGVGPTNNGLLQPASAQLPPGTWEGTTPASQWTGSMDYEDLHNRLAAPGSTYTRYWDSASGVPYIYSPTVGGGFFSSYEDKQSVNLKLDMAISKGLAGGFFWELSADLPATHTDSLLATAHSRLMAATTKVQLVQINDGAAQRSKVTSATVTFSSPVTFVGTPSDAFQLVATGGGTIGTTVQILSSTSVRVSFPALPDGKYTLNVNGSKIMDPTNRWVDADGNNTPGGNSATGFHRLFGDADGDRDVDNSDFVAFRTAFGNGPSIFDADGDGDTDNADFVAFRSRFGTTLP